MIEGINKIHHMNFLDNTLPDKCANLIIADPPYFEVKGEFDFIWSSFDEYLKDVEKWVIECKRILSDNGTLFWWGDKKKIAYSQIIIDKYFELENSIVWRKVDSMQYQYYSSKTARTFNTHNERLLMYSNGNEQTALQQLDDSMKHLNPFAKYLREEFRKAKITNKEISKLFPSASGGLTGCVSNWLNGDNIMTKEQYIKIKEYVGLEYLKTEYEVLKKEFEDIREKYRKENEDLKSEFEKNRRYFFNELKLEEVFEFSQEGHITKRYEHETKKPEKLTRALILTCSRPNDLVVVPFCGSGTECAMSAKENRLFYGFDIEKKYVDMTNERCKPHLQTKTLF